MRQAVIRATGCYLPSNQVTNDDLDWFPSVALDKIAEKTGVRSRRSADAGECTSDLAAHAARDCLAKADLPASAIEGIIVSTSSPDRIQPATATRVQHLLGAHQAFAFDINSVCSGSVYGISLADALIRSGRHENILFIAAEVYTRILNKEDFSTFPYFGDGAGAILFETGDAHGVLDSILRTDGSASDTITIPGGGTMMPLGQITNPRSAYFRMDGKRVYRFAIEKGTEIIEELLDRSGIDANEVDLFISHQANVNIIQEIADRLGVPRTRFFVNLDRYGNTASASVPIALDEAISCGKAEPGSLLVTVAFGGGLSWGANLIRL
jgi:3-oxoacyl-[acyl-carrier-protein] synthase-3